jgi:hypothetical protein
VKPSGATSQTPNNLRKKVGPAVWLFSVCVHSAPAEWSGDEPAWIAGGRPITDAQLAAWLGESARTIATWRLRLRKLGLLGWHVAPNGRAFWLGPVNRVLEELLGKRPAMQSTMIWRVIQERSIALTGKVVEDLSPEEGLQLATVLTGSKEIPILRSTERLDTDNGEDSNA